MYTGYGICDLRTEFIGDTGDALAQADLDRMRDANMKLYRAPFFSDRSWAFLDTIVRETARRGLTVLPVFMHRVNGALVPPRSDADRWSFYIFMRDAAVRYGIRDNGSAGDFWNANPSLRDNSATYRPIRVWEIWNEPNVRRFWPAGPDPNAWWAREYAQVLRDSWHALRLSQYNRILVGGLADVRSGDRGLETETVDFGGYFYDVTLNVATFDRDARKSWCYYDGVALHPYGGYHGYPSTHPEAANAAWTAVQGMRNRLDLFATDAHQLWITEFGWRTPTPDPPANEAQRIASENERAFQRDSVKLFTDNVNYYRSSWKLGPACYFCLRDSDTPRQVTEGDPFTEHDTTFGLRKTTGTLATNDPYPASDAGHKPAADEMLTKATKAPNLDVPPYACPGQRP